MITLLSHIAATGATALLRLCGHTISLHEAVITYHDRLFRIAPSCSGYRSLLALCITALCFTLLYRLHFWRGILLLFVSALLAITANIIRVSLTVLYPGWHDALGYLLYLPALYLMLQCGDFLRRPTRTPKHIKRSPLILLVLFAAVTHAADFPQPRLARSLRPEQIASIITNLPPGRTVQVPAIGLRPWRTDRYYHLGASVIWQSGIYYCVQSHKAHIGTDWSPDKVPALWRLVLQAGETIPGWQQPLGAHDSYSLGAIVMHQGFKWRSTIANNVWAPGIYGWERID